VKAIISHDVDHITAWEHKNDLIIPKYIIRNFIEFISGYISAIEIKNRFKSIIQNKWQNIEELMKFDKANNVPSTFFLSVSNGIGLNYSLGDAIFWIKKILQEEFDVGVHGIVFDSYNGVKVEYDIFKNISGLKNFGIRMHYLRNCKDTLNFLNEAGYMFDTTLHKMENPFKEGNLWEFPLHVMDVYIFCNKARWQSHNLIQSKESIKRLIEEAYNKGINYFTVLFHDSYFSNSFKTWKEWYIWLITYLKDNGFDFISFKGAINELEKLNE
jgi:hypothetical protein